MAFDFACPDWADRLREGRAPIPDLDLDLAEASRAVEIYNRLRLPDVTGQPPLSEASGEWFREIIRAAFGSLDAETGERLVGELFVLVPKKNAKTTGSAALGIVALLMNERPNADMLIVGPTQEIADVCFSQAAGMIEADPEGWLAKRFHVAEHTKTITCRRHGAKLRIKTFDMRVMTGVKPVLVIIDELHILGANANAARVIGQIRGGFIPFPEALLVIITTQSDEAPAGVFKTELQFARDVRDGKVTGSRMLPVLYEFPLDMQADEARPWEDPAAWPMVLPNLGLSISIDRLRRLAADAKEKGEGEWRRFASQHLNVEIGVAIGSTGWVGATLWQAAGGGPGDLDELIETSDVCTVGIDGGGLDDLLGLAVLGRCAKSRRWRLWARAWAHPIVLKRRPDIRTRLEDLAKSGELLICSTPTQDVEDVSAAVARIAKANKLPARDGIGLDPVGVAAIVDALADDGITVDQMVAVGQGYRLSGAVAGIERKLQDGTFRHAGGPLMAWCVGNARAETKGNATLIVKEAAGRAKIDPLCATLNAAFLMARNPVAAPPPADLSGFLAQPVAAA